MHNQTTVIAAARKCSICGSEFESASGRRFCSMTCRQKNNARQQPKPTFVACIHCGREFRLLMSRKNRGPNCAKCCSRRCAMLAKYAEIRRHRPPVVCKEKRPPKIRARCRECGGICRSAASLYCSVSCCGKNRRGDKNPLWKGSKPTAVCASCGKTYTVQSGSKGLVCSLACWGGVKTKMVKGRPHPTGKGGRRSDLGDVYFRSRWEANWARYLNWLKSIGEITSWEFEPDTFEFVGIKRGTRFYTPDFKVINKDASIEYHEVKGWLTPEGATKLKRMAKYHPRISIVLVDRKFYRSVATKVGKMIAGWERCPSHGM
jgi:hypothetical protein